MVLETSLAFGTALSAILAALGGVLLIAALQARQKARPHGLFTGTAEEISFLFDGETLLDATPAARSLIALGPEMGSTYARLLAYLATHFPQSPERIERLGEEGRFLLAGGEEGGRKTYLNGELHGGLLRLSLLTSDTADLIGPARDSLTYTAMEGELRGLRAAISRAPFLIWREDSRRRVIWANAAYLMEAAERMEEGQDITWPLPRLFEGAVSVEGAASRRLFLEKADNGKHWFDVQTVQEEGSTLFFALPADAVVQAEGSLRDFMQTLTKTFAYLPIGLAIFDRERQLQLFNPALVDLTGLAPDLLSRRPTLFAFLDAMRDKNMIPEPKDYRNWRRQMAELERAAASGQFEEVWNLPGGQTYRVLGRPHPNGALALMFEDISSEMSRTRRYRADVELGQSVVDALDEAVAVFAPSGALVMTNAAYIALWGHDPAQSLGDTSLPALLAHWREACTPTPLWQEAESYAAELTRRPEFRGDLRLKDGRALQCRFKTLQGGATLAAFRLGTTPGRGELHQIRPVQSA